MKDIFTVSPKGKMYDEMVGKDETWVDLNSRIDDCESKMSILFQLVPS